jgi:5'-nucleotidase (lipoprotein e(P4) family)
MTTAAPPATTAPTPVTAEPATQLARDIHWARNSAEHRAIYLEVYRAAGNRLETLAAGRAAGTWGVILDADETVIDNSEYEKNNPGPYNATAWDAWVSEGRAPALPGAPEFTARVRSLGGRVVIVTNRNDKYCDVTRRNLASVHITTDLVLCQTTTGDKNPRFDAVQNGTAAPGFPALTILEWIGDNIQDFPHLTQDIRNGSPDAFARFGDTFFALPNAMYGSWEKNPRQ